MTKKIIFRFDDIHPYMDKDVFNFILDLSHFCPESIMLCIIPDNKDHSLIKSNYLIPKYWEKLNLMESRGVTIGLHGLEHKLRISKLSLLGISKKSEYSGLGYSIQKKMILKGLSILRSRGLQPKFFAAPAHGFDETTLKVLNEINFKNVSDGFTRNVCKKKGLTWIPLKSWSPRQIFLGSVNTVCIHLNKENLSIVMKDIFEIVNQNKNIDFNTLLLSIKPHTLLDSICELIYTILIELLFIKRFIKKILDFIN